ncbi:MAG TPA: hypothetical protein VMU58_00500 [Gaiellaceae bacterium]|nr:hypothetical protein [Gaiellaceae bacterium]
MRRLMILIAAAAVLALPAVASANDGHSSHHNKGHRHGLFTKLTGTGTSFAGTSATATGTVAGKGLLASGTFTATLSTTWSQATTKTRDHGTLSCAPATLALTITDSASAANTTTGTITGKTCAFTKTDGTVVRGFFGNGTATGAGTLAALTGTERAFLSQKADGTVKGAVFAGVGVVLHREFTARENTASNQTGHCTGKH